MDQQHRIVFVCEHGAAKSILAAAYFNKFAREANLNIYAVARGIHPDSELSLKTIEGLRQDGLTTTEASPRGLSRDDVGSATQIIAFCELPEEFHSKVPIGQWNDIPPVSENYETARNAILARLKELIKHI